MKKHMKTEKPAYSGKFGSMVAWTARDGSIVCRRHVIPRNPRTAAQMEVRRVMAEEARRFNGLTDEQMEAWHKAAAGCLSAPRLRQNGPLTGMQLFVKLNAKLRRLGREPLDAPPPPPKFPELAPQSLLIANTGAGVRLKLSCSGDPGEHTVLRASPPQSPGVRVCQVFRILGLCPPPERGAADITALYTAVFGAVPVGKRLFVRASVMVSGFESKPREFCARVPAR
jgi:hypothetical protein